MNTNVLAAALAGFLLGGLTVSVAAELQDHPATEPTSPGAQVEIAYQADRQRTGGPQAARLGTATPTPPRSPR